jgi:peptidoglycan/LPS O-acetylase OafA/YrhL
MTLHNFLLALGVGSALIAFWCVVRFPDKTPQDFGRALAHVCVALLLGAFTPNVIAVLSSYGYAPALASLLGVLLPVLVYTFLSGAWVLKLAHDTIHRYRH